MKETKIDLKNIVILDLDTYNELLEMEKKLKIIESCITKTDSEGKEVDPFSFEHYFERDKLYSKIDIDKLCKVFRIDKNKLIIGKERI